MAAIPRTVPRIQLGKRLLKYRAAAGISTEHAAEHVGWDAKKLLRLEAGTSTIKPSELDQLAGLYEVSASEAQQLRDLADTARRRTQYGRIPDWARTYVEWESSASSIDAYETELIPGPFQTPDYSRAVIRSGLSSPADIEQLVTDRQRRREVIDKANPPLISAVLSEAAIRRRVGGSAVMVEQLDHLVTVSQLPHVTIQVLPFSAGEHMAMGTAFIIITLADLDMTAVYTEDLTSSDYLEGSRHVDSYKLAFNRAQVSALGPAETTDLIKQTRDEMV